MTRIQGKKTRTAEEKPRCNKTGMIKKKSDVVLGHLSRWVLKCEGGQRRQSTYSPWE